MIMFAVLVFFIVIAVIMTIAWFAIKAIMKAHDRWDEKRRLEAPLCVDCKYCGFNEKCPGMSRCWFRKKRCMITGKYDPLLIYCDDERDGNHSWRCGPTGRFFVKRESAA